MPKTFQSAPADVNKLIAETMTLETMQLRRFACEQLPLFPA